ncbi:hypothetical protein Sjap_023818 [Stephania japonica]|uniref:Pectate lyase n=1 Tax=Stephania japonica TaxID=461633 RepID=A0AAP0ECA6_9MAGN
MSGPCKATNPIDRCWRCKKNWARNRKLLASCVLGFGRKTVGGKFGGYYVVTDPSDNDMVKPKPGTLRHAVIQEGPLWIIFARSMVISLTQELIMTSDKTIDGRGKNIHISHGCGLTLQFVKNVIIHGLHIHDIRAGSGGMIRDSVKHYGFRTMSDGDAISVFGSVNIWIDHNSLSTAKDGLIDVVEKSTAITISNNHMTHHDDVSSDFMLLLSIVSTDLVMLLGASETQTGDKVMQVTVAFNHFGRGLTQRLPRCRFGFFHVVNNDYTMWTMYAIGGSSNPTIISQGNRFLAPPTLSSKEVTKREYAFPNEWQSWTWRSQGDLFLNGAIFIPSGDQSKMYKVPFSKKDVISAKSGVYAGRLSRYSGALVCTSAKPC